LSLFTLTACAVQFPINTSMAGLVACVPLLARELGADSFQIGLPGGVYQGMLFLSSAVSGRWVDYRER
jgi:hypothetical protein